MNRGGRIDVETGADLLRALGHATRLTLLQALAEGERSVSEIEAVAGIGQPGLSQQLAILRKARLVLARREAKQVFYSIDRARIADLAALVGSFAGAAPVPRPPSPAAAMTSAGGAAMFARVEPG